LRLARKRQWQKHKRQRDPDYQDNQRRAQQRWRQRHPDYWKRYRQNHPDYTQRNREQQRQRDRRRQQGSPDLPADLVKRDVSRLENPLTSGTYEIVAYPQATACKDGRVTGKNLFIISELV